MKVFALISGGKDSCFNMMYVVNEGHTIVGLGNLIPSDENIDELNSYMYQTVGHEAINLYAKATQLPLYQRKIQGKSKIIGKNYMPDKKDEVEDMYKLIKDALVDLKFDAVSCGAILSDYQRVRLESVCDRLSLKSLCYLWRRNQAELLHEMIQCHVNAILIKTAALGLTPTKHLGKTLAEIEPILLKLQNKYGSHCCGEGGEFETFTLDCPLFVKKIKITDSDIINISEDDVAPVAYLKLKSLCVEEKDENINIKSLPLMSSKKWENEIKTEKDSSNCYVQKKLKCKCEFNNSVAKSHRNGDMLSITGICSKITQEETEESVKISTNHALNKLNEILKSHGHTKQDLCYVHLNISDMNMYPFVNKVYKEHFNLNPPARSCIECISSERDTLFSLDCVSMKCEENNRRNMHVQSISHWACANIGPFSQCVQSGGLIFVSGTIGLVPGTMELVSHGVKSQANAALTHVTNILAAMNANSDLNDAIQCISYVTCVEHLQLAREIWDMHVGKDSNILAIFVVVDRLPKDALSEWQVIAKIPSEYEAMYTTTKSGIVQSNSLINRWKLLSLETEFNTTSVLLYSVDKVQNEDQSMDVDSICQSLTSVLNENHFSDKDVCNIRTFANCKFSTEAGVLVKKFGVSVNICSEAILGVDGNLSSIVLLFLFKNKMKSKD